MQAPYENSSGLRCGRINQGFDRMGGDCAVLVRARVPSNFAHLRVPPRALVNFAHGAIEDFLGPARLAPPHLLQRHRFAHNDKGTMSACAGKGQDTGSGVAKQVRTPSSGKLSSVKSPQPMCRPTLQSGHAQPTAHSSSPHTSQVKVERSHPSPSSGAPATCLPVCKYLHMPQMQTGMGCDGFCAQVEACACASTGEGGTSAA